jgi:hypothetical protein
MRAHMTRAANDHAVFESYRAPHFVGYDVVSLRALSVKMTVSKTFPNYENGSPATRAAKLLTRQRLILDRRGERNVVSRHMNLMAPSIYDNIPVALLDHHRQGFRTQTQNLRDSDEYQRQPSDSVRMPTSADAALLAAANGTER